MTVTGSNGLDRFLAGWRKSNFRKLQAEFADQEIAVVTADPTAPARRIAQTLHMDPADVAAIIDAGPDWADDIRKTAPEEFTAWIDATIDGLRGQAVAVAVEAHTAADQVRHLPRKDAAAAIQDHPQRHLVFKVLDGRDITAMVWAGIRPAAERPFMDRGEDVA